MTTRGHPCAEPVLNVLKAEGGEAISDKKWDRHTNARDDT